MKEWFGVLWIGLLALGCSQSGENGNDMGAQDLGSGGGGGYSTLSVVAGGVGGTGNADGIGTAARFNFLFGVTVDGAGNLFLADNGNCTVRKVVIATGVTTTLAGRQRHRGALQQAPRPGHRPWGPPVPHRLGQQHAPPDQSSQHGRHHPGRRRWTDRQPARAAARVLEPARLNRGHGRRYALPGRLHRERGSGSALAC